MLKEEKLKMVYSVLSVLLLGASIVIGLGVFQRSLSRVMESFGDLVECVKFYFLKLANVVDEQDLGVNRYSEVLFWNSIMSKTPEGVSERAKDYWNLFVDKKNFMNWLGETGVVMSNVGKVLALGLPILILLFFLIKKWYLIPNNRYNQDSLPLQMWKHIDKIVFEPVIKFIKGYVEYLKDTRAVVALFVMIWAINLNVATIIMEFIGFYFYFVVTYQMTK